MKTSAGAKLAFLFLGAGISMADVSAMLSTIQSQKIVIVENDKQAAFFDQARKEKEAIKIDPYTGGLDFDPISFSMPGMSPKEYGLSIYHGNKRKRSNRLRFSHNAKLKRR